MNPSRRSSPRILVVLAVLATAAAAVIGTRGVGIQPDGSILIPTGQTITPAGTPTPCSLGACHQFGVLLCARLASLR